MRHVLCSPRPPSADTRIAKGEALSSPGRSARQPPQRSKAAAKHHCGQREDSQAKPECPKLRGWRAVDRHQNRCRLPADLATGEYNTKIHVTVTAQFRQNCP